MAKSKSYNRIVFLTTLSLYLGLVLVGGTAPVLAHSATTKSFEIHNEIEVKDDLDNKPDGNPEFQGINISTPFFEFLEDLHELQTIDPLGYEQEKNFWRIQQTFISANESSSFGYRSTSAQPSKLNDSFERFFSSIDNKDLQNLADFTQPQYLVRGKRLSFELGSTKDLSAKLIISFEKDSLQKAASLAARLNLEFRFRVYKAERKFTRQVYENTKAFSENNQVFIVTRLPRAAIDSPLAEK